MFSKGGYMRTTLTLDDDVVMRLEAAQRRKGLSFKEIVNVTLRYGLEAHELETQDIEPFVVEARPLGLNPGLNYANTGELLEQLEGPNHQ
jgi:hypothetical protein